MWSEIGLITSLVNNRIKVIKREFDTLADHEKNMYQLELDALTSALTKIKTGVALKNEETE